MNLVEFFGTVRKPKKVKEKGLFCPLETSKSLTVYIVQEIKT